MENTAPIITPIYSEQKPSSKKAVISAKGTLADLVAGILSIVLGAAALGYSILFFTRFLENDSHLWGVISAFILCFGVGAFAYIPAALTSWIAIRAYKNRSNRKELYLALFLIVPWVLLSLILVFISDLKNIYAVPALISVTLLLLWAVISLVRDREITVM